MNKVIFLSIFTISSFLASGCMGQIDTFPGLVSWFPMDENAENAVDKYNNAIVYGATLTDDRLGRTNKAYHFNGNAFLLATYNSTGYKGMSYTAWIRTTNTARQEQIVLFEGSSVSYISHFSKGHFLTAFDANSWNNLVNVESKSNVANGQWIFIGASNDGKTTRLYVNGVLEKSYNESLVNRKDILEIGRKKQDDGFGFIGDLDDLRIYSRTLTDAEMLASFMDTSILVVNNPPLPVFTPFEFVVFPNPSYGKIHVRIDTLHDGTHARLYDATGRYLWGAAIKTKEFSLNLADYGTGMYFIRMTYDSTSVAKKVVISPSP